MAETLTALVAAGAALLFWWQAGCPDCPAWPPLPRRREDWRRAHG